MLGYENRRILGPADHRLAAVFVFRETERMDIRREDERCR